MVVVVVVVVVAVVVAVVMCPTSSSTNEFAVDVVAEVEEGLRDAYGGDSEVESRSQVVRRRLKGGVSHISSSGGLTLGCHPDTIHESN